MTISELGSLGEVIGAFGLIVTLVFLSMEMRLARQAEESRDQGHQESAVVQPLSRHRTAHGRGS